MINRKAVWVSTIVVVAMIAASLWRLSLLPDWHHVPADGPGSRTYPFFVLFVSPLTVLAVMGMFFVRKWLRSGPKEAVRPWQLYYGLSLGFVTAVTALVHAFNIARSFGALQSIERLTLVHSIFVIAGVFMVVAGNFLPKMPWLTARFRPLDPWQWNQHLRFAGRLTVAVGLFFAIGMPLLPIKIAVRTSLVLTVAMLAAGFWHRTKVRRDSSLPQ